MGALLTSGSSRAAGGGRAITAPAVSGTAARGHQLTVDRGAWSGARSFAYRWQVSRDRGSRWRRIAGATGPRYTPGKDDEGAMIRVSVSASHARAHTTTMSKPVGPVGSSPPVNESEPEIWGLARAGSPLVALSIGSWRGVGNRVRFQWQRLVGEGRWRNIAGAVGRRYTLGGADVGARVRLLVTATNLDRSVAAASAPTRPIAPGAPKNTAPPPAPAGPPVPGGTLTAQPGEWNPAGASIIYVWLRCAPDAQTVTSGCVQVGMGPTYTVAPADLGQRIGVRVNATWEAITASTNSALSDVVTSASVSLGGVARTVPQSFLGVSMETNELASFERNVPSLAALLRLLQTGNGPVALRVGGQSADATYLNGDGFSAPPKAIGIDSTYMQNLGALARSVPLSVMFDLNLEAHSPAMAAAVASEALKALPAGSLSGLEVGNEPDLYPTGTVGNGWNAAGDRLWAATYGPSNYANDFAAYATALAGAAPGVPLAGPALAGVGADWFGALLTADRAAVGLLTAHRYPLSACATPGTPKYPSIAGQLADQASAGLAATVQNAVATAHQAGLPFRVDELGSATCTGVYGVSDTFATALWATDALFNMLSVGVDGVNVHTRFNTANTAIWGAGTPRIRPLFYGMVAFARTLGPGAALLQSSISGRLAAGLSVWPVRVQGNQTHVLVINRTTSPAAVTLEAGAQSQALVRVLQSSSMAPGAQVTFGGQQLADDGSWRGTPVTSRLDVHNGAYDVNAPPLSASLLTFTGD